jgi:hypothetical protein
MRSHRKLITGTILGLSTLAAVTIGVTSWVWLPQQQSALERETVLLESRIGNLSDHMRDWHFSPDGDLDQVVQALPSGNELPGKAGELLMEISASGARNVHYNLGPGEQNGGVTDRQLQASFEADVNTLGKVFDRINLWRPSVSLSAIELESGDHNRISVTMNLKLLGNDDA